MKRILTIALMSQLGACASRDPAALEAASIIDHRVENEFNVLQTAVLRGSVDLAEPLEEGARANYGRVIAAICLLEHDNKELTTALYYRRVLKQYRPNSYASLIKVCGNSPLDWSGTLLSDN